MRWTLRGKTARGIIARAANDLCRYYAVRDGIQAKILRVPYLYTASPTLEDPILTPLFEACSQRLCCHEGWGGLTARCPLAPRSWPFWCVASSTAGMPHSRNSRFRIALPTPWETWARRSGLVPGARHYLRRGRRRLHCPSDTVRTRYGWFQRYDVLRDLSTIHARWEQTLAGKRHPLRAAIDRMRGRTLPIKCLETALAWVLFEGLELVFSQSAQLNVLDYRLLYVVLIGTLYGLDFGLVAALLASVGLAASYFTQYGYTFQGLFTSRPTGCRLLRTLWWVPCAAMCSCATAKAIRAERDQNELVRNRNTFLTQLYHDAIEDKRAYRRQIVGRHDSFGKIFAVTQELDVLNPRDIYRKCCELLGEILENDSVAIYHVSGGAFARLVAASPAIAENAARSLTLEQLAPLLGDGGRSNLWVNRELTPGFPMFDTRSSATGHPPC